MSKNLVAFIYAKGCGHCEEAKPHFEKVRQEFPQLQFGLLDIDKPGLNLDFPVAGTPTLYFQYKGRRFSTDPMVLQHDFTQKWMGEWLRACMRKVDAT